MRYLTNFLILICSFLSILLEEHYLSDYRTQIIGLLILSYFAITFLRRKYQKNTALSVEGFSSQSDIFIISTIILLLIIQTGSLYSPVFFLVYFLCFGITFVFEPISVFVFALGVLIIFFPQALTNHALENFIKIGSIFLIAPLAFFFGKEYKERVRLSQKVEKTKEEAANISNEIEKVIENEKNLKQDTKEKLSDALSRTKKLK